MGTVVRFPAERVRGVLYPAHRAEPAEVMILPVVRIERDSSPDDSPGAPGVDAASHGPGGRRRRRAPR